MKDGAGRVRIDQTVRERERERETQTHTKTHTHLHTKRLTNNGSAGKPPVESFKVNRCTTATITS